MENLLGTLQGLGKQRVALLGAVAVAILFFFGSMFAKMGDGQMQVLYADLEGNDINQVVAQLETMKIPYLLEENGAKILVPPEEAGKVRMRMAQSGLPRGGSLGYDIFDKKDGFGTNSFVQNINKVRALEGELSRTIASIDVIRNARVHLVLPQRELFSREKQAPSASVFLQILGGKQLEKNQILAIQHLVASAVPELQINNVAIIDDRGRLIARSHGSSERAELELEGAEQSRVQYENRLQTDVTTMLESVVGIGKARVQLTADMDFNKVTRSAESFDPESKVERSTQTVEESDNSNEREKNVTVENNLPEAEANKETGTDNIRASKRTEETTNYEISKVVQSEIKQTGTVKKLSVAVLIDGIYGKDKNGKQTYKPREQQELDQLAKLVKSAIGFDESRGDKVEIVNMQFADLTAGQDSLDVSFWEKLDMTQYVKMAETMVVMLMGLMVLLLVVRPLMTKLMEPAPVTAGAITTDALLAANGLTPALEGPDGVTIPQIDSRIEEMLDLDRIDGQIKASSVKKIGEIIEQHPDEAIRIIRAWIYAETQGS